MEIAGKIFIEVVREAQESEMLKRYLSKKLKGLCGISHGELEDICAMLGIREEGDDE